MPDTAAVLPEHVLCWTTQAEKTYRLGTAIYEDTDEMQFDLSEGEQPWSGEFLCSNLTREAARWLRHRLDAFLGPFDSYRLPDDEPLPFNDTERNEE